MNVKNNKYRAKHASEAAPDPAVAEAVREKLVSNAITCIAAEEIAVRLLKPMREIGVVIDLLGGEIIKCQLGFFGYQPRKKIVPPTAISTPEIEAAIKNRLLDGRLPCAAAWEIAAAFALPRINIAAFCEQAGIKIKPCQLGAF